MIELTCSACGRVNQSPTIQFRTTGDEGKSHGGMVYVCGSCSMVLGPVKQEEPVLPARTDPVRSPQVTTRSNRTHTTEFDALAALAAAPQDGDVVINARQRVRVLNRALKLADKLRKERDALKRLLDAARKPRKISRPVAVTAADRVRRLPS